MEVSSKKILSLLARSEVVAVNSPDLETKVGSILVSKKTHSVISEGYNGFVRGANDEKLPKTRPDKYEYIVHAEENLITNAARNGVRTDECFAVQTISPCVRCARLLYQAGIDTVFYKNWYHGSDRISDLGDLLLVREKIGTFWKMTIKPNVGE